MYPIIGDILCMFDCSILCVHNFFFYKVERLYSYKVYSFNKNFTSVHKFGLVAYAFKNPIYYPNLYEKYNILSAESTKVYIFSSLVI